MARVTPLLELRLAAGVASMSYGPAESGVQLVEGFAPFGLEYAAIRSSAGALDAPSRGLVVVRGADRHAFLQRMITQDLRGIEAWSSRRGFWLNRKGRIDADLEVVELPAGALPAMFGADACTLLELDVHAAQRTVETLNAFVIADDVIIEDWSDRTHIVQLHGPAACAILAEHAAPLGGPSLAELANAQACAVEVRTASGVRPAMVLRRDSTGEIGLSVISAAADARAIYEAVTELPSLPDRPDGALAMREPGPRRARRIGWHAFNVARIEAGTPLYNIDYGPTSLPHEVGSETLRDRVNFKKGCYLGQEVVARMESLGHPKQRLVGLRLTEGSVPGTPQPVTGSLIMADASGPAIGAITSSAMSPMLSGALVCLAMVKHAHTTPGSTLMVQASPDALRTPAVVQPSLRFWGRG